MGCPKEVSQLISTGDKDAVIRYMERHKMTHQFFTEMPLDTYADLYYPVVEAAKQGQLDIMNTLIDRGFDPEYAVPIYDGNQRPIHWNRPTEQRPIHWACQTGNLHIVKCLIEDHNVNLNAKGRVSVDEEEPLLDAMRENHIDIVKYLVESGATMNDRVLGYCAHWCDPEMVEYCLSKGLDVNARDLFQTTPLLQTVFSEFSYSNALVLLDAGADVDARDGSGNTTFLCAANKCHNVELMRLLVSRGADPNAVNNFGDTALHMALKSGHLDSSLDIELIKYLVVELGLECLNTRNSQGITPFTKALKNGSNSRVGLECDKTVLELLVNYGCDITDDFDMSDDNDKDTVFGRNPNYTGLFERLKQFASQSRSLKGRVSLKLRSHLGVRLESAVKELPLPEILKDIVRIQKMDVDM